MNNLEDIAYINRLYDELNTSRSTLMSDLKNDTECQKEKTLTQKILCIDNLMKNVIKYRNIVIKEKLKCDL
jgi:hypothetical protein